MVAELKALQPGSDTKVISLYDVDSKVETQVTRCGRRVLDVQDVA